MAQGESVCRVWSAEGSQERSEAKHEHFEERALASDEKWSPFIMTFGVGFTAAENKTGGCPGSGSMDY